MIQIGKYQFDGPWLLANKDFLDRAAVYAILCKREDRYGILYIGETGELGTRLSTHHKKDCWEDHCSSDLYVAVFWTPSDEYSKEKRKEIEQELIRKYNPPCND